MGISPARSLPLQHMQRLVTAQRDGIPPDPPTLGPDEMQLYSYYRPGLVAGDYEVTVLQDISANVPVSNDVQDGVKEQTLQVTNVRKDKNQVPQIDPQTFEVVVPRFTLDPTLINSYYPPDGHQDEGRILPHIVLNDPHYPWEVDAGSTTNMNGTIDGDRNLVPWVALLVFDPDDLRIETPADVTALNIPNLDTVNKQQNAQGTFSMQVKDYFSIPQGSHIDFQKGYGDDTALWDEVSIVTDTAKVIFPTKELFSNIFKDPESMKYLAHVRNIRTDGFPDAGIEETGLFSIVISSRTGQFDITKLPCTQICHLISIENVDSTVDEVNAWLALPQDQRTGPERIGLFSLCSWVYTALPPDPLNFIDTVRNLVTNQQMFRADEGALMTLQNNLTEMDPSSVKAQASQVLLDRLQMGYSFTRWRPETGEETAALNRGPLVPQQVQQMLPTTSDLPDCSNTSKEFQILDQKTGLIDLSYSSAWQLGKTLAISDTVFSAALLRFRSALHNSTASVTRSALNNVATKEDLLQNLHNSLHNVHQLSKGNTRTPERLQQNAGSKIIADISSHPAFKENLKAKFDQRTNAGSVPYNGFNVDSPNDSDWVIIHDWMAEKLALSDIPPHYLIPEPSFVPAEAIRFFYIDDFWLDCLIDGALSVANHLNHDDDLVRSSIKSKFNDYLNADVPGSGIKPQIPGYGFILRSQVVKAMPDLRITVNWSVPDPPDHLRSTVVRYTRYDDTTLICLLDRWPEELDSIVLAQPPHQQRFCLGTHLSGPQTATSSSPALPGRLEVQLKRLYTSAPIAGEWKENTAQPFQATLPQDSEKDDTYSWLDWNSRCIQLGPMMKDMTGLLQRDTTDEGTYADLQSNSCELGMELNDPSYFFTIRPPKMQGKMVPQPPQGTTVTPPDQVIVPRNRQLYINEAADLFQPPPAATNAPTKVVVPSTGKPAAASTQAKSPLPSNQLLTPPSTNPPNIQPRIQPVPPTLLASRAVPSGSTPNELQSQFKLAIHADYKPYPLDRTADGFDPNGYIPTHNLYFFDLIFSLNKISAASRYPLLEIQIDIPNEGIPIIPNHPDPNAEPLLQQNYDGPGLHMLANQRFIPFLYYDTDHMRVQLLPRTAADNYQFVLNDRKSAEVGFRLGEANIAHVRAGQYVPVAGSGGAAQWRGVAKVTMVEIYATDAGNWPVTTVVEVVKWAVRDQEDIALEKMQ